MGISDIVCRIVLPQLGLLRMCVGNQPNLFLKSGRQDKPRCLLLATEM